MRRKPEFMPDKASWSQLTDEQQSEIIQEHVSPAKDYFKEKEKLTRCLWSCDIRSEKERTDEDGKTSGCWYGRTKSGRLTYKPRRWRKLAWADIERYCEANDTASITMKSSPRMAKVMKDLLTREAERLKKVSTQMVCEHNAIRTIRTVSRRRLSPSSFQASTTTFSTPNSTAWTRPFVISTAAATPTAD